MKLLHEFEMIGEECADAFTLHHMDRPISIKSKQPIGLCPFHGVYTSFHLSFCSSSI